MIQKYFLILTTIFFVLFRASSVDEYYPNDQLDATISLYKVKIDKILENVNVMYVTSEADSEYLRNTVEIIFKYYTDIEIPALESAFKDKIQEKEEKINNPSENNSRSRGSGKRRGGRGGKKNNSHRSKQKMIEHWKNELEALKHSLINKEIPQKLDEMKSKIQTVLPHILQRFLSLNNSMDSHACTLYRNVNISLDLVTEHSDADKKGENFILNARKDLSCIVNCEQSIFNQRYYHDLTIEEIRNLDIDSLNALKIIVDHESVIFSEYRDTCRTFLTLLQEEIQSSKNIQISDQKLEIFKGISGDYRISKHSLLSKMFESFQQEAISHPKLAQILKLKFTRELEKEFYEFQNSIKENINDFEAIKQLSENYKKKDINQISFLYKFSFEHNENIINSISEIMKVKYFDKYDHIATRSTELLLTLHYLLSFFSQKIAVSLKSVVLSHIELLSTMQFHPNIDQMIVEQITFDNDYMVAKYGLSDGFDGLHLWAFDSAEIEQLLNDYDEAKSKIESTFYLTHFENTQVRDHNDNLVNILKIVRRNLEWATAWLQGYPETESTEHHRMSEIIEKFSKFIDSHENGQYSNVDGSFRAFMIELAAVDNYITEMVSIITKVNSNYAENLLEAVQIDFLINKFGNMTFKVQI